jgi:hypothetical protein
MKTTKRRKRQPDQLASAEWVRSVFDQIKQSFPLLSSFKEADLVRLARAVRHIERYTASDTRRGRPPRWPREDLLKAGSRLSEILVRETQGRISLASFVDHYIRILRFPSDVIESMDRGDINLFEAEQLARITASRTRMSSAEARRKRVDILAAHLRAKSSGDSLRRRVNELLGASNLDMIITTSPEKDFESLESLEDFDPYDTTHLLWEEIKQLGFAFRDIRREDVTEELLDELLKTSQPIWAVLAKIQRRKQKLSSPNPST